VYRSIAYLVSSFLFSLIFLDARDRDQSSVSVIQSLIFFLCGVVTFMATPLFFHFVVRWNAIAREIKADMYGPVAYWLVSTLLSIVTAIVSTFALLPPIYVIADFNASTWFRVWALLAAFCVFYDTAAELCSFDGREIGIMLLGTVTAIDAFSNGFFQNGEDLIWPLRAFYYIFPGRWTMGPIISIVLQESPNFDGAVAASSLNGTRRDGSSEALQNGQRFYCPHQQASTICYGITGLDVVKAFHEKFSVVEADVSFWKCFGWSCLIAVVCRLLLLLRTVVAAKPPNGREQASSAATTGRGNPTEKSALLPQSREGEEEN